MLVSGGDDERNQTLDKIAGLLALLVGKETQQECPVGLEAVVMALSGGFDAHGKSHDGIAETIKASSAEIVAALDRLTDAVKGVGDPFHQED